MATALIRKLGLAVQGYTAPQIITHGGEPQGYKLGSKGTSGPSGVTYDQCGYETYASLYTISTSCATSLHDFHVQCFSDFVPLLGCNTYEQHYYQCAIDTCEGQYQGCYRDCVGPYYDCNRKINEANIPYLNGKLVAYGTLSLKSLPMTHNSSDQWTCITSNTDTNDWSRLYSACDVAYLYSNINNLTIDGINNLVQSCSINCGLYNASLDTIACQASFRGNDPKNTGDGYILMAMYTPDAISSYSSNTFQLVCEPTATDQVLAPNCGLYLATFYGEEDPQTTCYNYYLTGLYQYNIQTNTLGANVYKNYFSTDKACRQLIQRCFYYDANKNGLCYSIANINNGVWNESNVFAYIEMIDSVISNQLTYERFPTECACSAFIHSMQLHTTDPDDLNAQKTLDFYNIPLCGYMYYDSDVLVDQVETPVSGINCLDDYLIYSLPIPNTYAMSAFKDIRQYHWSTESKVTLTNVMECMNVQGGNSNNNNNNGGT